MGNTVLKRWLVTLGLAAVVVILIAIVVIEPGKDRKTRAILTPLKAGDIQSISISKPGRETIVLRRTGAHWQMLAPLEISANQFRIDRLLRLVSTRSRSRFAAATADRAGLKLDPALATLQLDAATFSFGGTDALDGNRYVEFEGDIHLIADLFHHHLFAKDTVWINRLLLGDTPDIVAIKLPDLALHKTAGLWSADPPPEHGADALNALAAAWRHAQAIEIRSLGETSEDARRIVIEFADGDPIEFLLAQEDSEADAVLARPDKGIAYVVSATTAQSLLTLIEPVGEPNVEVFNP